MSSITSRIVPQDPAGRRTRLLVLLVLVAMTSWLAAPRLVPELALVPIAQEDPAQPPADAPAEEEAGVDVEAALADLPFQTYQVFLARDPFEPVVPPLSDEDGDLPGGGGAGPGGGGDGDQGGSGDPGGFDPDGGFDPGGGNGGDFGPCRVTGATAVCEGVTVTLLEVVADASGERIVVEVEDTLYEVAQSASFAEVFTVLAIDDPCATLVYQDTAFPLCLGGASPGGGGGPGGSGDGPCSAGSNSASCEGTTVTLLDVVVDGSGERATVQVDDTLYEVAEGMVFAGSFEVLSIDAPCVTLLYGDDAFTICEGDRVLK